MSVVELLTVAIALQPKTIESQPDCAVALGYTMAYYSYQLRFKVPLPAIVRAISRRRVSKRQNSVLSIGIAINQPRKTIA